MLLAPVEVSEPEKAAEPAEDVKLEPLPPEQLTEFEGDYYTEELDTTYAIRVRGDGLVAQHRRHDGHIANLRRRSFSFGDAWFFPEIHFIRDDTGRVTGFKLTGNRVRNLYFEKKTH